MSEDFLPEFLLPCGSWRLKSGSQVAGQVPFPPEPSCWPSPPLLFEAGFLNEPEVHQLGEVSRLVNLSDLHTPPLPRSCSRLLSSGPPACVPGMVLIEPQLGSFMWDFCPHPTSKFFWAPSL